MSISGNSNHIKLFDLLIARGVGTMALMTVPFYSLIAFIIT